MEELKAASRRQPDTFTHLEVSFVSKSFCDTTVVGRTLASPNCVKHFVLVKELHVLGPDRTFRARLARERHYLLTEPRHHDDN